MSPTQKNEVMESSGHSRKRGAMVGVVFLVVAGVAGAVIFTSTSGEGDSEGATEEPGFEVADRPRGQSDLEEGGAPEETPGDSADSQPRREQRQTGGNGPDGDDRMIASVERGSPDGEQPRRDESSDVSDSEMEHPEDRPMNRAPREWMATPEDVDYGAIDRQLDNAEMRREFELTRRADRRRTVELAEEVIASCEDRHSPATGDEDGLNPRIALEWTMRTEGGEGVVEEPRVLHRLGVDSPPFERCVTEGIRGLEFEAEGDGAEMEVRSVYEVGR